MPPLRTFPVVKPVKTERTHEENQERAYIAASRRSDRSLEARVESARRASEIHKRRTGRSLRVTEQDVINEEMYEEEDDDLPSQYRRLTAHLQTGSADFNRRLAAYLTNHVAMRTALNDAIHGSFAQQYPNAPQFAHNSSMFPSPLMTQGFPPPQQQQSMQSPLNASPQAQQQQHQYRQAPYPVSGYNGYRPQPHQRSLSMQVPSQEVQTSQTKSPTPMTPLSTSSQQQMIPPMTMPVKTENPDIKENAPLPSPQSDALPNIGTADDKQVSKPSSAPPSVINDSSKTGSPTAQKQTLLNSPAQQMQQRPSSISNFAHDQDPYGPFSMSLPMESQQMMHRAALPQNDFGASLMGGSETWMYDFGASDPGQMLKPGGNFVPSISGMSATLAPDSLLRNAPTSMSPEKFHLDAMPASHQAPLDFGNYLDFGSFTGQNSGNVSAAVTPGIDSSTWKEFIDQSWQESSNVT